MEYRKVALLGAGAVGSYLIWGLSEKKNIDFFVVADGERKARLEKEGLCINGKKYYPEVRTPGEAHGADLLIVTLKYDALRPALVDIRAVCDEHTVVMSLMNGVDSEEIIGKEIGPEHIVYSLIKVASERRGNEIRFDPETTIGMIYGERNESSGQKQDKDAFRSQSAGAGHGQNAGTRKSQNFCEVTSARRGSDRVEALNRLFDGTGLHYRQSDCILSEIWGKFLLNVSNNLIQAIIGCGVGGYSDSSHMAYLRDKLREEVIEISKSKGIDLSKIDDHSRTGSLVKPRARYSTLQDLDAKRHTEIDMFSGAVVRMGKELGIPTPYNDAVYHLIKAMEEKNDGMFDYDGQTQETACSR